MGGTHLPIRIDKGREALVSEMKDAAQGNGRLPTSLKNLQVPPRQTVRSRQSQDDSLQQQHQSQQQRRDNGLSIASTTGASSGGSGNTSVDSRPGQSREHADAHESVNTDPRHASQIHAPLPASAVRSLPADFHASIFGSAPHSQHALFQDPASVFSVPGRGHVAGPSGATYLLHPFGTPAGAQSHRILPISSLDYAALLRQQHQHQQHHATASSLYGSFPVAATAGDHFATAAYPPTGHREADMHTPASFGRYASADGTDAEMIEAIYRQRALAAEADRERSLPDDTGSAVDSSSHCDRSSGSRSRAGRQPSLKQGDRKKRKNKKSAGTGEKSSNSNSNHNYGSSDSTPAQQQLAESLLSLRQNGSPSASEEDGAGGKRNIDKSRDGTRQNGNSAASCKTEGGKNDKEGKHDTAAADDDDDENDDEGNDEADDNSKAEETNDFSASGYAKKRVGRKPVALQNEALRRLNEDAGEAGQTSGKPSTDEITMPRVHDVLCGRGNGVNKHIGNIKFRKMLEAKQHLYKEATITNKPVVASNLVWKWKKLDPPGRFLKKSRDGTSWMEMDDVQATLKVSKRLRDGLIQAERDRQMAAEGKSKKKKYKMEAIEPPDLAATVQKPNAGGVEDGDDHDNEDEDSQVRSTGARSPSLSSAKCATGHNRDAESAAKQSDNGSGTPQEQGMDVSRAVLLDRTNAQAHMQAGAEAQARVLARGPASVALAHGSDDVILFTTMSQKRHALLQHLVHTKEFSVERYQCLHELQQVDAVLQQLRLRGVTDEHVQLLFQGEAAHAHAHASGQGQGRSVVALNGQPFTDVRSDSLATQARLRAQIEAQVQAELRGETAAAMLTGASTMPIPATPMSVALPVARSCAATADSNRQAISERAGSDHADADKNGEEAKLPTREGRKKSKNPKKKRVPAPSSDSTVSTPEQSETSNKTGTSDDNGNDEMDVEGTERVSRHDITSSDVLFANDEEASRHAGNRRFGEMIGGCIETYGSSSNDQKFRIAVQIALAWESGPPEGRFLVLYGGSDDTCARLGLKDTIKKIQQVLEASQPLGAAEGAARSASDKDVGKKDRQPSHGSKRSCPDERASQSKSPRDRSKRAKVQKLAIHRNSEEEGVVGDRAASAHVVNLKHGGKSGDRDDRYQHEGERGTKDADLLLNFQRTGESSPR